jgi:flavin-dependent dehydrogenase
MTGRTCDVAIVGGGPAGCATALALRAHAPGLEVALLEATAYDRPRLGETLPPLARRLLDHLNLAEPFDRQGHRPVHGTAAAWGVATPRQRDYLFALRGHGWHLDRSAFDAMLAAQAAERGVTFLPRTRVTHAEPLPPPPTAHPARRPDPSPPADPAPDVAGWRLWLRGEADPVTARFLVDATGPSAALARRLGARAVAGDRLTAFARLVEEPAGGGDPRILVEAFADGWWYTAGLPGGRRIAACLTDADIARRLGLADAAAWERCLAAAPHVHALLRGARRRGTLLVRTARTRRLEPAAGDAWLAVGDAAALYDPLSSQGILKALRSGVFAAYAIGDLLTAGDRRGLARYARHVRDELSRYRAARQRAYAEETRWPESDFWRRRHAVAA